MNATAKINKVIAKEEDETRKVVLQNRMAFDLVLASQGGFCQVIGSECYIYVFSCS